MIGHLPKQFPSNAIKKGSNHYDEHTYNYDNIEDTPICENIILIFHDIIKIQKRKTLCQM